MRSPRVPPQGSYCCQGKLNNNKLLSPFDFYLQNDHASWIFTHTERELTKYIFTKNCVV